MASATILIVEDHSLNRELITDLLEMADYTVLQAEDGAGLLDLHLPGVDGLTPARQLMANSSTQPIPPSSR